MRVREREYLPRSASPEAAGVSSVAVAAFMEDMKKSGIENHSFLILRHGKVAAECFFAPFTRDTPHAMYSVSKSFTSTAIGFAVDEGLLSLDAKVIDFFPEYRPKQADEKLEKMTVRHLLTMTSGKNPSLLLDKTKDRWVKDFFDAPWISEPGEMFLYVSENIYMLCAILVRVTGISVTEFLTPRLYEPLGIPVPYWETDHHGIEVGGWGLMLPVEDFAKFTLCYAQNGVYHGKQVIPAWWVQEATAIHSGNSANRDLDANAGYGYCFWQCGGAKNTYRSDGMFSQFGIVFKDYDAQLVVNCAEVSEQKTRDCIWRHFPGAFLEEGETVDAPTVNLKAMCDEAALPMQLASFHSELEKCIEGKTIHMRKKILINLIGFPVSVLPFAATYMTKDRAGNIDRIRLHFAEDECTMDWVEGDEENSVVCGMDGHYRYGQIRLGQIDYTVCCTAAWKDDETLDIWIRPLQTIAVRKLNFIFKGNQVRMTPRTTPPLRDMAYNIAEGIDDLVKHPLFSHLLKKAMHQLWRIAEPVHKGKLVEGIQ